MTIKLIAIGKTDSKELQTLIEDYKARLQHFVKFEMVLIPDLKNTKSLSEKVQKEKEGTQILKYLESSDICILLDENGKHYTSVEYATFLQKKMNSGIKNLCFIIGGPYGFSSEIYQRANGKISLSKMTFSHQMIRLFFIEQLYRANTILHHLPYHHR